MHKSYKIIIKKYDNGTQYTILKLDLVDLLSKIKFEKQYPDFSRVPYMYKFVPIHGKDIHCTEGFDSLPKNSQVVYCVSLYGVKVVSCNLSPLLKFTSCNS